MESNENLFLNDGMNIHTSYKKSKDYETNKEDASIFFGDNIYNYDDEDVENKISSIEAYKDESVNSDTNRSNNCSKILEETAGDIFSVSEQNYKNVKMYTDLASILSSLENKKSNTGEIMLKKHFVKYLIQFIKISKSNYWTDQFLTDSSNECDNLHYLNEGLYPTEKYLTDISKTGKGKKMLGALCSLNVSVDPQNNAMYHQLPPLKSVRAHNPTVDQHGVIINTGTYIRKMSWAPTHPEINLDQILAVAVYKELTERLNINDNSNPHDQMVQIYNCGQLKMNTREAYPPRLEMVFVHNWGKVADMTWCPQPLPIVRTSQKLLGHLALCCSDGFIRIIPICKLQNPGCFVTLDKNHPVLCLGAIRNRGQSAYPTTMHWRQEFPNRIVAGYNTGHIGLFVLEKSVFTSRSSLVGSNIYLKPSVFRKVFDSPCHSVQINPHDCNLVACSFYFMTDIVTINFNQQSERNSSTHIASGANIGPQLFWSSANNTIVVGSKKSLANEPGIFLSSSEDPTKNSLKLPISELSVIEMCDHLNVVPVGTSTGKFFLFYFKKIYEIISCRKSGSQNQSRKESFYFQYHLNDLNTTKSKSTENFESALKTNPCCKCPSTMFCVHRLISNYSISINTCENEICDWQLDSMIKVHQIVANPNPMCATWIAVALECGMVHIVPMTHFYRSDLNILCTEESSSELDSIAKTLSNNLLPKDIRTGRPRKNQPKQKDTQDHSIFSIKIFDENFGAEEMHVESVFPKKTKPTLITDYFNKNVNSKSTDVQSESILSEVNDRSSGISHLKKLTPRRKRAWKTDIDEDENEELEDNHHSVNWKAKLPKINTSMINSNFPMEKRLESSVSITLEPSINRQNTLSFIDPSDKILAEQDKKNLKKPKNKIKESSNKKIGKKKVSKANRIDKTNTSFNITRKSPRLAKILDKKIIVSQSLEVRNYTEIINAEKPEAVMEEIDSSISFECSIADGKEVSNDIDEENSITFQMLCEEVLVSKRSIEIDKSLSEKEIDKSTKSIPVIVEMKAVSKDRSNIDHELIRFDKSLKCITGEVMDMKEKIIMPVLEMEHVSKTTTTSFNVCASGPELTKINITNSFIDFDKSIKQKITGPTKYSEKNNFTTCDSETEKTQLKVDQQSIDLNKTIKISLEKIDDNVFKIPVISSFRKIENKEAGEILDMEKFYVTTSTQLPPPPLSTIGTAESKMKKFNPTGIKSIDFDKSVEIGFVDNRDKIDLNDSCVEPLTLVNDNRNLPDQSIDQVNHQIASAGTYCIQSTGELKMKILKTNKSLPREKTNQNHSEGYVNRNETISNNCEIRPSTVFVKIAAQSQVENEEEKKTKIDTENILTIKDPLVAAVVVPVIDICGDSNGNRKRSQTKNSPPAVDDESEIKSEFKPGFCSTPKLIKVVVPINKKSRKREENKKSPKRVKRLSQSNNSVKSSATVTGSSTTQKPKTVSKTKIEKVCDAKVQRLHDIMSAKRRELMLSTVINRPEKENVKVAVTETETSATVSVKSSSWGLMKDSDINRNVYCSSDSGHVKRKVNSDNSDQRMIKINNFLTQSNQSSHFSSNGDSPKLLQLFRSLKSVNRSQSHDNKYFLTCLKSLYYISIDFVFIPINGTLHFSILVVVVSLLLTVKIEFSPEILSGF